MVMITQYAKQKKRHRCTEQTLGLCGEGEGGMFWENSIETSILSRVKQITSPGWMHETCAGTLGRPRGMGWGGRQEERSGWGIHVNPWLIHVNVWQNPLQYCKVISLQLIKINEKKKNKPSPFSVPPSLWQPPFHFLSLWIWLLWVDYIRAITQHLSFCDWLTSFRAFLVAQLKNNLPVMWETSVRSLGWEDPLEKGMATHTGILAWRIPWAV